MPRVLNSEVRVLSRKAATVAVAEVGDSLYPELHVAGQSWGLVSLELSPAGMVQAGPSCSISHLDDVISPILAVDSLDSAYV